MTAKPAKASDRTQAVEVGDHCACFAVRKTARAVTQLYDRHLAKAGLRITQFTLLNALAGFGAASANALAAELVMDRTTLSRNLKPLIAAGLIETRPDRQDRRVKLLRLTGPGRRRLAAALPHWDAAQAEFLREVGEKRWGQLAGALRHADRALVPGDRPSDLIAR